MTRVIPDPLAVARLLSDPRAVLLVSKGAADTAREAAEIVPRATGHAAASYHATPAKIGPSGLTATAYTDDIAGHLIEFGSAHNPAYAPLRRGVERAGFRGKPNPKGAE